jgi:hypothetical protein
VTASQPASLVVSAATAPAAHETESAGRLEGGRRGVRAHHFRVTHELACHGERPARPPDQRPPHHHHALLLMNTHYHDTRAQSTTVTTPRDAIAPSPAPASCPPATAATAPPPRRAHYFRVTTDRARRAPPPPTPAAAPAHAVDRAHPRTRFAPRTATVLPARAANGNPAGDPSHRRRSQFTIHCRCSRPSALLPLGPCAAGPPAHPGPRSRRRRAQRKCPLLALGALALPEQSATCVGYSLPPPPAPRTSIDAARVASSARRARQQSAGTLAKHPRAHCSPRATAPRSLGNLAGCVGRCRGCDGWL